MSVCAGAESGSPADTTIPRMLSEASPFADDPVNYKSQGALRVPRPAPPPLDYQCKRPGAERSVTRGGSDQSNLHDIILWSIVSFSCKN